MTVLDAQLATISIDDGLGSPILIGEVISFTGLDGEATVIDISTLASLAKEFRQGLQDFGNFSMELFADPSDVGQIELLSARAAQSTREFILTLPSGDVATFDAFVLSVTIGGAVDAVVTRSVNLKVTGSAVFT